MRFPAFNPGSTFGHRLSIAAKSAWQFPNRIQTNRAFAPWAVRQIKKVFVLEDGAIFTVRLLPNLGIGGIGKTNIKDMFAIHPARR